MFLLLTKTNKNNRIKNKQKRKRILLSIINIQRILLRGNLKLSVTRKKQSPKNKKRITKGKAKLFVIIFWVLYIIIISILEEYTSVEMVYTIIVEIIAGLLISLVTSTKKCEKKHFDIWYMLLSGLKQIVNAVRCNPIAILLISLASITPIGVSLGKCNLVGRTIYAMKQACSAFVQYDQEIELEEKNKIEIKEDERKKVDKNVDEILKNQNETTQETVKKLIITQQELQKDCNNISEEDFDRLFYLEGEYKITDWKDQDEINQKVFQKVKKELSKKRENVFDKSEEDGGAPERICNIISTISDTEANVKKFSEKMNNLDEREHAYAKYPKESLAILIANDYQDVSLVFYYNGGSSDSILYYYAQSIKYQHETLSFDGLLSRDIKNTVSKILSSYKDLEIMYSDSDIISYYARKLKIAYQFVEDQY